MTARDRLALLLYAAVARCWTPTPRGDHRV
jgi:hypothetical protein